MSIAVSQIVPPPQEAIPIPQSRAPLTLKRQGVPYQGPIAHPGFGAVSLYFTDPWGTRLEIVTWLSDFATAQAAALQRGGAVWGQTDSPARSV